ncbi:hypothetical protein [Sphaerisporangium aureirubrum]|uniref:Uncharacterized protein n=1 Tax=Sphaerisporangium aureirubrum TaxID=1544736 RepID=A0ABW1NC95_9ACTN
MPVVLDILRKSQFMGGNFTLDARRIIAALDKAFPPATEPPQSTAGVTGAELGAAEHTKESRS